MGSRGAWTLACALVAITLAGCAGGESVDLDRWRLTSGDPRVEPRPVQLPDRFELPRADLTYSLRTFVQVPARWRGGPLSLSVDHLFADAVLYVGGDRMPSRTDSGAEGFRGEGPAIWSIPSAYTDVDTLNLELRIRHSWALSGWFDTVPRLQSGLTGDPRTAFVRGFNRWTAVLGFGTLMTISFTYLLLFVIQRERRWYGWLALQMALASVYLLFIAGNTEAVGRYAEVPLFGGTMSLAVLCSIYAVNERFELGPPSRFWAWLALSHPVVALLTLGPFTSVPQYGPLAVFTVTGVNLVHIWRLAALARRQPRMPGVLPNLVAWSIVAVTAPFDAIPWLGLPDVMAGLRIASLGLTAYALIMFVALCGDHLRSLRRADELNVELASGLERIEQLNVELQRQIAERSRQLAETMARLAQGAGGPPEIKPGDVINDRYRVVAPIGAGAMGAVYRVERIADGQPLAAKVLTGVANASQLARFAREAQTASEIRHPSIVTIVDVDFSTSGFMFLVMELVDGPCLRDLNERFGDTTWAEGVIAEVAGGLAAVHGRGVIHRDLKPANVLVTQVDPPAVKITDFGIATIAADGSTDDGAPASLMLGGRPALEPVFSATSDSNNDNASARFERLRAFAESQATATATAAPIIPSTDETWARPGGRAAGKRGAAGATARSAGSGSGSGPGSGVSGQLTRTGALLGTPVYMAPELAEGARFASSASDVWSLGVMAFELLTGDRPFAIPPCLARTSGMAPEAAPDVRDRCPHLREDLAALVQRSLSFEPAERPSAGEVARAFAAQTGARVAEVEPAL